jgi:hypothetical protein
MKHKKDYFLDIDLNNKLFIYFLGLFWADGYIKNNSLVLEFSVKDIDDISLILNKIGVWYVKHRIRKNSNTETVSFMLSSKEYTKFFIDNDYIIKSKVQPLTILELIPSNLKYLFFLGLYDGDGSIYFNKKTKTYNNKITITSTINYDWNFLFEYLKSLGINNYSHFNKKYKSGSSSDIQICKNELILKLCGEIYKTYEEDKIGLKRKYEKYCLIKEHHTLKNKRLFLNKNKKEEKKEIAYDNLLKRIDKYYNILLHSKKEKISIYKSCLSFKTRKYHFDKFLLSLNNLHVDKNLSEDYLIKKNKLIQT